jgi:hypothetical protein
MITPTALPGHPFGKVRRTRFGPERTITTFGAINSEVPTGRNGTQLPEKTPAQRRFLSKNAAQKVIRSEIDVGHTAVPGDLTQMVDHGSAE